MLKLTTFSNINSCDICISLSCSYSIHNLVLADAAKLEVLEVFVCFPQTDVWAPVKNESAQNPFQIGSNATSKRAQLILSKCAS